MTTYFERYQRGTYEAVWTELTALGSTIRTNEVLFRDAEAVAIETMQRVQHNTVELIRRLQTLSYRFTAGAQRYRRPSKRIPTYIRDIESRVGFMPLSVAAFMTIVGSVDLTGQFPESDVYRRAWDEDVLPDPFVFVYSPSFFRYSFQEWAANVSDFGVEDVGAFLFAFAPDEYHKADISGGPPYSIQLPNAAIDAVVEDEWHRTTFVSYLRTCFQWGGFPGLARATHPPMERIRYLTKGLTPF